MKYENIKIEYQNTPQKFQEASKEVVSFLVDNLWELNTIEEECSQLFFQLEEYQKRGIRIKGMPKDKEEIWKLYKTRYGEAVHCFCTEELMTRGYTQSMAGMRCVFAKDGTLIEEKAYGKYSYLKYGCELSVTMKSNKRATIEIFFITKDRLIWWHHFTLIHTNKWWITDKKWKSHKEDKWKKDTI